MNVQEENTAALLGNIAAHLRCSLNTLYLAARKVSPPHLREESAEADRNAAALDRSYYQILRQVNNLSAVADMADSRALPFQSLDITRLLEQDCAAAADLAQMAGRRLFFRLPSDSHLCCINGDALERILHEFLSNALKFTPEGGSITVELQFDQERKKIILSVTDTGCGISEDVMPTLFSRYLCQDPAEPPPHGIGLGLSLCRRLAERMGGSVLAQSRPGKGSKFVLSLPDIPPENCAALSEAPPVERTGGFHPALLAFSDTLPGEAFLLRSEE